jgi:hypothetical protein
MIRGHAANLLGRHIADGAEHHSGLRGRRCCLQRTRARRGGLAAGQLGQSEVQNLDPIVRGDEQILGLEIAMGDSLLVRRRKSPRHGDGIADRLSHRDGSGQQPLPQCGSVQKLRHDERRIALCADVVDREDIGVVEGSGGAGFLLEPLQAVSVARKSRRQDLDCDVAPQSRIARPIHHTHPAGAERREYFVGTEARAGGKGHTLADSIAMKQESARE